MEQLYRQDLILGLLPNKENALDSFNEALAKYREGEAGKLSAYKFAILHMAHFLELVLKMYVQTQLFFQRKDGASGIEYAIIVAMVALVIMLAAILVQIVARYVFAAPPPWTRSRR